MALYLSYLHSQLNHSSGIQRIPFYRLISKAWNCTGQGDPMLLLIFAHLRKNCASDQSAKAYYRCMYLCIRLMMLTIGVCICASGWWCLLSVYVSVHQADDEQYRSMYQCIRLMMPTIGLCITASGWWCLLSVYVSVHQADDAFYRCMYLCIRLMKIYQGL